MCYDALFYPILFWLHYTICILSHFVYQIPQIWQWCYAAGLPQPLFTHPPLTSSRFLTLFHRTHDPKPHILLIDTIFRIMASVLLCCMCEKEIGGRKPDMFDCFNCKKPFHRKCKPEDGKTKLHIYSVI